MKKLLAFALTAILSLGVLSGCQKDDKTLVIGASPTPHAEILAEAAKILEKDGYKVEIKEFTDYVQPNLTLQNKELTANYFQHLPYLENFNKENKTDLVSAGEIHYEPFAIYPGKSKSLAAIPEGGTIAVPNDSSNEARALFLLEAQDLIKLKDGAALSATIKDIVENPKNLKIQEIEAAQLVRSLQDVDAAVINGNYALGAGLKSSDVLAYEDKDSYGYKEYGNIVAVRKGDENKPAIKALISALKSDEVKKFIEEKYDGGVVPLF